jgi:hypothetical protein
VALLREARHKTTERTEIRLGNRQVCAFTRSSFVLCEYFVLSLAFDMPSIKASIRALIGIAAFAVIRLASSSDQIGN